MYKQRKILLRIIFLLGVLLCSGISRYSDSDIPLIITERSSDTQKEVNTPVSEIDIYDDEQINAISEFYALADPAFQLPVSRDRIFIFNYTSSLWQPPRNKQTFP